MRLFVGLDLPYEMRRNLELLLHLLKPLAPIQWSTLDNLHLTTKFIGEFPEARLEELKSALAAVPRPGGLHIAIRGLSWFPDADRPRVFVAGIQAPPGLAALAAGHRAGLRGARHYAR
jgi:2'-5' RNA ligase